MTMKLYYEKDEDRITTDATIAHYGVKGMRWGVRRQRALSNKRAYLAKKGKQEREDIKSAIKTAGKFAIGQTETQKLYRSGDKAAIAKKAAEERALIKRRLKTAGKFAIGRSETQKATERFDKEIREATKQDVKDAVSKFKSKVGNKFRQGVANRQEKLAKEYQNIADSHNAEAKKSFSRMEALRKESNRNFKISQDLGEKYIKAYEKNGGKENSEIAAIRKEGAAALKKAEKAGKAWVKEQQHYALMDEIGKTMAQESKNVAKMAAENRKRKSGLA